MALVPSNNKPSLPTDFNSWVRHYVHFFNLTRSFQNQTTNARQLKDMYEEKVIQALKQSNMEHASIQINGGKIQLVEDKCPAPLSFVSLERLLHDYYRAKGSRHPDETDSIMNFIKQNRKSNVNSKLKCEMVAAAGTQPALPPLQ